MLRLIQGGLGLSNISAAAAGVKLALAAGNVSGAADILRAFSIPDRLEIGVEALESGGVEASDINAAIKAAATSPVEVKATQQAIEMAPDRIRRALTPWWATTQMKVLGVLLLAAVGWSQYQKRKALVSKPLSGIRRRR